MAKIESNPKYKAVVAMILEGSSPNDVHKKLSVRRGYARRVLKLELAKLGAKYDKSLRIRDGKVVHEDVPLRKLKPSKVAKTKSLQESVGDEVETSTPIAGFDIIVEGTVVHALLGGLPAESSSERLELIWGEEQWWKIYYPRRDELNHELARGLSLEMIVACAAKAAVEGRWENRASLPTVATSDKVNDVATPIRLRRARKEAR